MMKKRSLWLFSASSLAFMTAGLSPASAVHFRVSAFGSDMVRTSTHTNTDASLWASLHLYSEPSLNFSKLPRVSSVCFITDNGDCGGNSFGGGGTEDKPGGGVPEIDIDKKEQCRKEGYLLTSCNAVQQPSNYCPYDNTYFEKCVCRGDLKTCNKPEYGVGESCGGKYASCQRDDARACRDDGYPLTAACSSTQQKNDLCPYNSAYYKQCVCKPEYKFTCSGTGYAGGSGSSCNGKYAKCTCMANYEWTGSVCAYVNPCAGYYDCGGSWQYCTGSKCASDSTKCSVYCVNDYFPNSCSSSSNCNGVYRNGYCSGSCVETPPQQPSVCDGISGDYYYCNCSIKGVVVPGTRLVVALETLIDGEWEPANRICNNYQFCSGYYGRLPTKDELMTIHNNISAIQSALVSAGGSKYEGMWHWTSTPGGSDGHWDINPVNGVADTMSTTPNNNYARPVMIY